MNAVFLKSFGRCGSKLLLLACLALFPLMVMATDSTYISPATVSGIPPVVDATNFYNAGVWNIITAPSPYRTSHTLNYTNVGTMTGTIGWEFDWGAPSAGQRSMSANFVNKGGPATISATDSSLIVLNGYAFVIKGPESYLWISATNIINQGTLIVGAGGELKLTGKNVNLSHSGLEVTPVISTGSANNFGNSNYTPDVGIYDLFWQPTNTFTIFEPLWDGTNLFNPLFSQAGPNAVGPCGPVTASIATFVPSYSDSISNSTGLIMLTLTNLGGSTTNVFLATNQSRQAVFVWVSNTNAISVTNHYSPSPNPTNIFYTTAVQLSSTFTNVITGQAQTNFIYIVDDYVSFTNGAVLPSSRVNPLAVCSGPTYRPVNYVVSRSDPGAFGNGVPGLGKPSTNFLYDPLTFSNSVISGTASIYGVQVDNQAVQLPAGTSVTNLPGRVRIYADNLNLSQTKIRAEGQIVIQTTNLTGSVNAAMDSENLSFKLASATGNLNFTNLALPIVDRLHGTIVMVSSLVTNFERVIFTNNYVASNVVSGNLTNIVYILSPLTNFLQITINTLVVDASGLQVTVPVTVQDLILNGTNIVISDSVSVDQSLILNGQAVTLQGNFTLFGSLPNWVYTNAPSLRYFTNNGFLSVPNNAHFGDDGPTNYLAFVNNSFIVAGGQTINSVNLQINNGTNVSSSGGFYAVAQTAQLTNATIFSSSDIQFAANTLQIRDSVFSTGGALNWTVTNSFSDGGASQPNLFLCENGFNLWIKPTTGSLLGTSIDDFAFGQSEVDHVWAGQNLGASPSGFVNNCALNTLILDPLGAQAPGYLPLFAFFGATGNNGMYVSNLDLSLLTDYANEIQIDPSLTIYYATASLNPVVNTGIQTPEQFLSGQFGGHLQWVGVTSFLKSKDNAFTQKFQLTANYDAAAGEFQLVQNVMPGQTNITEVSTDLFNWVPIYTNIGSYSNFGPLTITDPNSQSYPSRFYRLKILP